MICSVFPVSLMWFLRSVCSMLVFLCQSSSCISLTHSVFLVFHVSSRRHIHRYNAHTLIRTHTCKNTRTHDTHTSTHNLTHPLSQTQKQTHTGARPPTHSRTHTHTHTHSHTHTCSERNAHVPILCGNGPRDQSCGFGIQPRIFRCSPACLLTPRVSHTLQRTLQN